MGSNTPLNADASGQSRWPAMAWLILRATLISSALLVAYYLAIPGGKFFYQGF